MSDQHFEHEGATEDEPIKVEDRRHWAADEDGDADDDGKQEAAAEPKVPSLIDEYRRRTEEAEAKLHEYIEAFKSFKGEQDEVRARLRRDVDRKAELKFGQLVGDLLESVDHLDLALAHAGSAPEVAGLAQGVELARNGFIQTLERHGVEKIQPEGQEFDPMVAEALRLDPVESADRNDTVTETIRPGYRLGETVIRPARVAVGKHSG